LSIDSGNRSRVLQLGLIAAAVSNMALQTQMRDVMGIRVSRGYLVKCIQKVSASLDQPYAQLLERLPLESTVNVDETGHKDNR